MQRWNKNKNAPIHIFVGILLFIGVGFAVLWLVGPIVGRPFCSLVDCLGGGIDIKLVGHNLPEKYSIEVDFPAGKRTFVCDHSQSLPTPEFPAHNDGCTSDGAFFSLNKDVVPPEKITVMVHVDGKTYSQEFSPAYEKFQPNGKNCSPTCYSATIEMKITP